MFWPRLHDAVVGLLHIARRFERFFRPAVDSVLREPAASLIQDLINRQWRPDGLAITEERAEPYEEQHRLAMIDSMSADMRQHWQPENYQHAGNTKTHERVRGTVTIRDTRAHANLQAWILKAPPLFYFTRLGDLHLLDGLMLCWWNKTQSNPLGERYWSCVPYLLGEGQR